MLDTLSNELQEMIVARVGGAEGLAHLAADQPHDIGECWFNEETGEMQTSGMFIAPKLECGGTRVVMRGANITRMV